MADTNEPKIDEAVPLIGKKLVQSRLERYGAPQENWDDWGKTWEQEPNWNRVVYDRES